jgi:DNA-binding CsgD family transcriptional regulator
VQLSIAEWDRGRFGEALGHIEHAISILRSWPTSDEYLRALATWGGHLHRLSSPRIVEAVAALDRAAQQTGSPIAIQETDIGRAGIAIAGGELATARAYAQKAVAAAEASRRPLLLERALRPLASLELEWGDVHEAVRLTERGIAAARRVGVPTLEVVHRTLRLYVGLYVGEWELLDRGVRELLELAHRTGSGRGVGYALVLQGTLAVYRGDVATASASRDAIRTVYGGGRQDDRHLFSSVETLTALIDLAQGRPAQAAERLEANLRSLQMMHVVAAQAAAEARIASGQNDLALAQAAMLNPAIAGAAADAIVEAAAEAEPDAAGRAAENAVAKATPSRHGPWADASSHWIHGLVSAARGEADAAAELQTAAESLDRLGLAFPAAAAWLDWARVVVDAAAAIDVLTERLSFLDEIGARPLADRARSQLRKLGARPTPARAGSAPATPGSLSPRELEVAQLVADGLANTEIAQRLFISPRTVTTHLQHVYERLGISSRTALARWFLEQTADAPAAPVAAEYVRRTMPRQPAQTRPSSP